MNSLGIAYIIWFFAGVFGIHRFLCGRIGTGILWACTGGLFGIGWLVDLFLLPSMVRQAAREGRFALDGSGPHGPALATGYPPPSPGPDARPGVAPANRVIYCTQCGSPMQVPANATGAQYACPACRTVLEVPG